jgi:feruloyl esterase
MNHPLKTLVPLAATLVLAACSAPGPRMAEGRDLKAGCESLAGLKIPAERIVWPGLTSGDARVDTATWHAGNPLSVAERGATPAAAITPAAPAHCRVVGRIAPVDPKAEPIQFQVNLPAQWNGRSVQFGGGGFNGVLITGLALVPGQRYDTPGPLAKGYVTVGTDSGHQSKPGQPPMAFALNDEMLVNFAHAAYPKVRNVSMEIMKAAYGRPAAHRYFVGSSEGGREGLVMAQRYPEAFDGIFSRVPVINWTGLQFAGTRNGMALMDGGWMNPAQVQRVHDATLAVCDADDGLADGIVSNPAGCLKAFDPATLRCAPGQAADSCLSDAQIQAIRTLRTPFRFPYELAHGVTEYPGWGIGGEATPASGPTGGWQAWWTGRAAPTLPPRPENGIAWTYGSGALQYFYARDPNADPRRITPESVAARVREVSALMDATNPDLRAFQARRGKLIMLEYMSDYAQSAFAGAQYLEATQRRLGPRQPREFMRLYTAPGVDHVGTGAPALVDVLDLLADWVENGRAPLDLEVVEQEAKPPFKVLRSRPLCEWPRWPKYVGGPPDDARSFACFF